MGPEERARWFLKCFEPPDDLDDPTYTIKMIRAAEADALERAAKIAEAQAHNFNTDDPMDRAIFAILTMKAEEIRALKS
jgi:hypothetical protein